MRVVIAPDKFAGTLSAAEAANAMAAGWRAARPSDEVVVVPMADGGEGTLAVVAAAVEAEVRTLEVADPLGRPVEASWLRLPDGSGLVEAAQACGLWRVAPDERNPRLSTTYGVGQLLRAAVGAGCSRVIVGLGGSATVDGGAGLAVALGHRLLRADGNGVRVGAEFLTDLVRVEAGPPVGMPVTAAADVTSPLLGPEGAVATYAPQKGATEEDLPVLERALQVLAHVAERDLPDGPWRDIAGAGAAGGLGFGLAAFAGAQLMPGAALVAQLVGLERALAGADVVVTGEGSLDAQTAEGKAPAHVADAARRHGAAVVAVAGQVTAEAAGAFDAVATLGAEGLRRPAELVRRKTEQVARDLTR